MRPATPRGFRDVLPDEAAERDALERSLGDTFASWGYGLVQTPLVERHDVLEAAAWSLENMAFRLIDLDGRMLALRPDMTVPIARLVASRFGDVPGPYRFRYAGQVFREHESLRGQSRQFTQAGVELLGETGPVADAEVISVLVEALRGVGLEGFTVAVGTVAVLSAIVAASGASDEWRAEVFSAAHDRNRVELDRLAAAPGIDEAAAKALYAVPRIRGGREAIAACRAAAVGCGCDAVLDDLERTFELLEAAGVAGSVILDFSVMRGFDYYTGLVVEAYAPGLGVALGGGGRYDDLLAAFDAPMPAAGFALGIERLVIALADQNGLAEAHVPDVMVGGAADAAFALAARLRSEGRAVVLAVGSSGNELAQRAARLGCEGVEAS